MNILCLSSDYTAVLMSFLSRKRQRERGLHGGMTGRGLETTVAIALLARRGQFRCITDSRNVGQHHVGSSNL